MSFRFRKEKLAHPLHPLNNVKDLDMDLAENCKRRYTEFASGADKGEEDKDKDVTNQTGCQPHNVQRHSQT